jgi:hypothetical protein
VLRALVAGYLALRQPEFVGLSRGLEKPQKWLLGVLGAAWCGAGIIGAIGWGATCVAREGGTLALVNAWCAELAVFGFVCWNLLGVIVGFPLYHWLVQRNRTKAPN